MTKDESSNANSITFTFMSEGSASFGVTGVEGSISAQQLLALAGWLEFEGKSLLAEERYARIQARMQEEQKSKIHVAEPGTVLPNR